MTAPESPATQHPEAPKLTSALGSFLANWNSDKMQVEYLLQSLNAKGLLPNADGTAPDALGAVNGVIGGTTIALDAYAAAILGLNGLVTALQAPIATGGPTIEKVLVGYARS